MPDLLTADDLAALKAAHEAMSVGPWRSDHFGYDLLLAKVTAADGDLVTESTYWENGEGIALTRNLLPAIVATVAELQAEVASLKETCRGLSMLSEVDATRE